MKQLFQDLGTGEVELGDVPAPALAPGCLLVRTAFSAVSPGTERAALGLARKSLIGTARERPDLLRRVLELARREGPLAAWRRVRERLSGPLALGYSSSGTVLSVSEELSDRFRPGDRVACGGAGRAVHAETVSVPGALAVRLPDGLGLEAAAFTMIGTIALHAVRQAEAALGERVGVVGLGLLGQLSVQELVAAGCRVAAFDLVPERVARARTAGAETALAGDGEAQARAALSWSQGAGLDAVIVAAACPGDEPMVAAAAMARDRGRVVALGLVPHGLPRELAFAKELELRIARSSGAGRFDEDFELRGRDYPLAHVRWTETRNMEAVLSLLAEGRVDPLVLVERRLAPAEAAGAYDELLEGGSGGGPLAVLLDWSSEEAELVSAVPTSPPPVGRRSRARGERLGVGLVGAGAFARGTLLPLLRDRADVELCRVVSRSGLSAVEARERFGFAAAGTDPAELLADERVGLVVIATRHDSHAALAAAALRAGRDVLVEKPLALSASELRLVESAAREGTARLSVGFNRRFSAPARAVREAMRGRGPLALSIRVAAGALPAGHWLADPLSGGGRLLGEGCHFVDLLSFLAGDPGFESVEARPQGLPRGAGGAAVLLRFADGSVGELLYLVDAAPGLPKERVEVHGGGATAIIDDFRSVVLHEGRRRRRLPGVGKGHAEEIEAVVAAALREGPAPVPLNVLLDVSRASLAAAGRIAATAEAEAAAGAEGE